MKLSFTGVQAVVLSVAMAFGLCGFLRTPANVAYAEEWDEACEEYVEAEGEYLTAEEMAYYDAANSEPQPWDDSTRLPILPGKIYLTTDVTLSKTYKVPASFTDIDLNGSLRHDRRAVGKHDLYHAWFLSPDDAHHLRLGGRRQHRGLQQTVLAVGEHGAASARGREGANGGLLPSFVRRKALGGAHFVPNMPLGRASLHTVGEGYVN